MSNRAALLVDKLLLLLFEEHWLAALSANSRWADQLQPGKHSMESLRQPAKFMTWSLTLFDPRKCYMDSQIEEQCVYHYPVSVESTLQSIDGIYSPSLESVPDLLSLSLSTVSSRPNGRPGEDLQVWLQWCLYSYNSLEVHPHWKLFRAQSRHFGWFWRKGLPFEQVSNFLPTK